MGDPADQRDDAQTPQRALAQVLERAVQRAAPAEPDLHVVAQERRDVVAERRADRRGHVRGGRRRAARPSPRRIRASCTAPPRARRARHGRAVSAMRTSPSAFASASIRTTVTRPTPSASAIALWVISSTKYIQAARCRSRSLRRGARWDSSADDPAHVESSGRRPCGSQAAFRPASKLRSGCRRTRR